MFSEICLWNVLCISLGLSYSGSTQPLESIDLIFAKFGDFQPLLFWVLFSPIILLLSLLDSDNLDVKIFCDNLTLFFPLSLHSDVDPIHSTFLYPYFFFRFQNFHLHLLLMIYFFTETFFVFILSVFIIFPYNVYFKIFTYNSDTSIISVLASLGCFLSFSLRYSCSLVWWVIFCWNQHILDILLWD